MRGESSSGNQRSVNYFGLDTVVDLQRTTAVKSLPYWVNALFTVKRRHVYDGLMKCATAFDHAKLKPIGQC